MRSALTALASLLLCSALLSAPAPLVRRTNYDPNPGWLCGDWEVGWTYTTFMYRMSPDGTCVSWSHGNEPLWHGDWRLEGDYVIVSEGFLSQPKDRTVRFRWDGTEEKVPPEFTYQGVHTWQRRPRPRVTD